MDEDKAFAVFLRIFISALVVTKLEYPDAEFLESELDRLEFLITWQHSARLVSVVRGYYYEHVSEVSEFERRSPRFLLRVWKHSCDDVAETFGFNERDKARAYLIMKWALESVREDFTELRVYERVILSQSFMTEIRRFERFWFEFGDTRPGIPYMLQFAFTFLRHGGRIPTRPNVQDARPSL